MGFHPIQEMRMRSAATPEQSAKMIWSIVVEITIGWGCYHGPQANAIAMDVTSWRVCREGPIVLGRRPCH
jgi:hypothetical protein